MTEKIDQVSQERPQGEKTEIERLLSEITPGEWKAANGGDRDQFLESKVVVDLRVDEDGLPDPRAEPQTFTVCYTPYDTLNCRADMRFIAAAPRLLREQLALVADLASALKGIVAFLDTVEWNDHSSEMSAEDLVTELSALLARVDSLKGTPNGS